MAIDNSFMIKHFLKLEKIYVLISPATHLPFVECDESSFDDQVYMYAEEEAAKNAVVSFGHSDIALTISVLKQEMLSGLLMNLYAMGVNRVVIQDVGAPFYAQLEELKEAPDLETLKNDKVPRINPECQLTGIYFAQELRRKIKRNNAQKKELVALEEEWAVNLMRSRLIVSLDVSENGGPVQKDKPNQRIKIPVIKNKKGEVYQPCFTDLWEFQKFNMKNKNAKFQLIPVSYDDLPKHLVGDNVGFVINPAGYNLTLKKKQMEILKKKYAEE